MTVRKILYISYDGMTDSLGQSQVLPYLSALSRYGYQFTILSFEKKERFQKYGELIRGITKSANIRWVPLIFTSRPPMLSKLYDTVRMRLKAFELQREEKFAMVHCRSYIAADIGLRMKRKFGIKFLFDMRGFWADEKKDGGSWSPAHPVFSRVYKYYKRKEAEYLQEADHIISLTHAGEKELKTWPSYNPGVPVTVIPCCADMQHFSLTSADTKKHGRAILNISGDRFVVSYLGSVGSWYMLDEMLDFFQYVHKAYPSALFLFITHSDADYIRRKATMHQIGPSDILVIEATRQQVPVYMKASDITISFIRPVYSKISSSPTKLGEVLSMGIPVIVNSGVGDVEEIVNRTGGGLVMHHFEAEDYKVAVKGLSALLKTDPNHIRQEAAAFFDLAKGVQSYLQVYRQILPEGQYVE